MQYLPRKQHQPTHQQDISKTQQGFGVLAILLLIIVAVLIVGSGIYVWHHHTNKTKPTTHPTTTTSTTSSKSGSSGNASTTSTGSSSTADPYVGWRTYCDSTYHYCFRYPGDSKLTIQSAPQQPCDAGQVTIVSADDEVNVSYQNDNNHDGALPAITPVSIETLDSANQFLTVLGSYLSVTSSNYLPSYAVVDSSELTTYPLAIGTSSQFPEPAEFTDQGTGTMSCSGSFTATPSQPISTLSGAQAWFTTPGAQTSLQILKSFYYK